MRGTKPSKPRAGSRTTSPRKSRNPSVQAGSAPSASSAIRLQKYISQSGVASRRAAEDLIRAGKVTVGGLVVRAMGTVVDPRASVVTVEGRTIRPVTVHTYLMLNKPRRVMCTLADPGGRPTIKDLLPKVIGRVYPIGRLDWDAEGLLLLTDDGELASRLMHPRHGVERTYHAKVRGRIAEAELSRLERGVYLEDGRAAAEAVRFLRRARENSWITLTLREGRHHEVKRMCQAVGHPVQRLRRVSYAGLGLGKLPLGVTRGLDPDEVAALRRVVRAGGGDATR